MRSITIDNALKIDGWMSSAELLWLAVQAASHKAICEIGSWKGRSTRALAENTLGQVTAVDTWAGTPGEDAHADVDGAELLKTFLSNIQGLPAGRLRVLQGNSVASAALLASANEKFDLIFIDADHHYAQVKDDIAAWRPLLAPNGLLCGHDYAPAHAGVVKAVNEEFGENFTVCDSIWYAQ